MSGTIMMGVGIGMLVLAAGLLTASILYRNTTGKKIREELKTEYEKAGKKHENKDRDMYNGYTV